MFWGNPVWTRNVTRLQRVLDSGWYMGKSLKGPQRGALLTHTLDDIRNGEFLPRNLFHCELSGSPTSKFTRSNSIRMANSPASLRIFGNGLERRDLDQVT